jgi:hypothetical protein
MKAENTRLTTQLPFGLSKTKKTAEMNAMITLQTRKKNVIRCQRNAEGVYCNISRDIGTETYSNTQRCVTMACVSCVDQYAHACLGESLRHVAELCTYNRQTTA